MAISRFNINYYLLHDNCLVAAINCCRHAHYLSDSSDDYLMKEEFLAWLNANEHQVDFFTKDEAKRVINSHKIACHDEECCGNSEHLLSPFNHLDDFGSSSSCLVCKEGGAISFYGISLRYHVRYDNDFASGTRGKVFIKMKDQNKITF